MPNFSPQLKKLKPKHHGSYTLSHLYNSKIPSFRARPNYEWDPAYPNRQQQLAELRGELNRSNSPICSDEFLQAEEINAVLRAPLPRPIQEEIQQAIRIEQALQNIYVGPDSFSDKDDGAYLDMRGGGAIDNEPLYAEIMPADQVTQTTHPEQAPYVNYDFIYELELKKALGLDRPKEKKNKLKNLVKKIKKKLMKFQI